VERLSANVVAVIPVLDEAATIASVIAELRQTSVERVIVVDGGSRDDTVARAQAAGAEVISEPRPGYGRACLAGARAADAAEVVLFLDGDGSDDARAADRLVGPILAGEADLVLGARRWAEPGAIAPAARLGNAFASLVIRVLYGARVSDLAPFKAVRGEVLRSLEFRQLTYGWTTELLVSTARRRLRILEQPVRARRRGGGRSKVSGTVRGSVRAGVAILRALLSPVAMDRLLVMAKAPRAGQAKTRLAAAVGAPAAAALAEAFLADTLALVRGLPGVQIGLFCPAGDRAALRACYPVLVEEQRSSGLFAGLEEALARSRALGFRRTVLLDGDSPTLPRQRLTEAFAALQRADVVLGPTADGGYYVIGAHCPLPPGSLTVDVPPAAVFSATAAALRAAGLRVHVLAPWFDVDTGEDLARLQQELAQAPQRAPATAAVLAQLGRGG
jgi:rSAM/selenodomain-associated transferase 1